MSKKKSSTTLSDKIFDLIAPQPMQDPEIDSEDETLAKTTDYLYEDDGDEPTKTLSDIRKKNVKLLHDVDAKYRGKVASRKDFEESEESDEDFDDEDNESDDDLKNFSLQLKNVIKPEASNVEQTLSNEDLIDNEIENGEDNEEEDSEDENDYVDDDDEKFDRSGEEYEDDEQDDDDDEEEEDDDDDDEDDENDDDQGDEDDDGDELEDDDSFGNALRSNSSKLKSNDLLTKVQNEDQQQKGASVQNQLEIWEKLLEMRIHSQKMLITANSLPNYAKFNQISSKSTEYTSLAKETEQSVSNLLLKMRKLQKTLIQQFPETKEIGQRKRKSTNEINDSQNDSKREKISQELEEDFNGYKDYQYSVITKWHDRTKVLTPGSVRLQQTGSADILRKIEGVLANKSDLIKKSQLQKGNYELFEQTPENEVEQIEGDVKSVEKPAKQVYCAEIYDDTDFYHTQLRELIEFKTNTSAQTSNMAKQFVELQKIRKKMKKQVDTRASKGRKIRYVVHNKLVSFMAPNESNTWTDDSKTELYRSLFGAGA